MSLVMVAAASAADLYVKAPPAVYSWTGCYVGGNAGYAWGTANSSDTPGGAWLTTGIAPADLAAIQAQGTQSTNVSGFTGGGQIGCNWQTGRLVFGIEGDGEYLGVSSSSFSSIVLPTSGVTAANSASVSAHSLFTVRPRAGFAVDRTLFYVTGGLAMGNVSYSDTQTIFAPPNPSASGSVSSTRTGYAVGGGVEYALSNHWTAGAEYLYVNLGSVGFNTVLVPPPGGLTYTNAFNASFQENIVRARANYKF
ncbi:MAG: outer membrane protein [Xanthobacteraceae bacterium]